MDGEEKRANGRGSTPGPPALGLKGGKATLTPSGAPSHVKVCNDKERSSNRFECQIAIWSENAASRRRLSTVVRHLLAPYSTTKRSKAFSTSKYASH